MHTAALDNEHIASLDLKYDIRPLITHEYIRTVHSRMEHTYNDNHDMYMFYLAPTAYFTRERMSGNRTNHAASSGDNQGTLRGIQPV